MNANRIKAYFYFTRKERLGIMVFLTGIVLIWFAPLLLVSDKPIDQADYDQFRSDILQLQQSVVRVPSQQDSSGLSFSALADAGWDESSTRALFYFDPNSLPPEKWQQLGLSAKTAKTIKHYLDRGGRFYRPEDIRKIYGLKKQDYNRLLPFVRIPKNQVTEAKHRRTTLPAPVGTEEKYKTENVLINSADTAAFVSLPGIGRKLAERIVNFRNRLGGFYSVDQIAEVYGISDSVFRAIKPYLQCDNRLIRKIDINTADIMTLKAHPYIKYQLGNAVIQYRMQHGSFQSLDELKKIHLISDTLLQKLKPYLKD